MLAVITISVAQCGEIGAPFLVGEGEGEEGEGGEGGESGRGGAEGDGAAGGGGEGEGRSVVNICDQVTWMLEDFKSSVSVSESVVPHIMRKLYNAVMVTRGQG